MKKIFYLCLIIFLGVGIISCDNQIDTNNDVEEIIELIDELPETITLSNENDINTIEERYNALKSDEQKQVTNYQKFILAKETLSALKQQEEDKNLASEVDNLIIALPSANDLTLSDKTKVESAREAYNVLTDNQKAYVEQLEKLEALEAKLSILEGENTLKEEAAIVVSLIDALPSLNELTISDKENINNVRNEYESLSDSAKQYVTNLSKLESLEEKIVELEQIKNYQEQAQTVIGLINQLPSVSELTIDDETTVNSVKVAYDNLSSEAKGYVTNYDVLENALKQIATLVENRIYNVNLHLNGGFMDGLTEVTGDSHILEFNVNYYSTAFFTYPDTEIFIYKTSLMGSNDTFTYAYKIGFSYNNELNQYIVDQIIKDEVAFTTSNKTSEFYILVYSGNTEAYNSVQAISIGHFVNIDVTLPDAISTSLSAKVSIVQEGEILYYTKEFKGMNTLPVPVRDGYIFLGWYQTSDFSGAEVTEVSDEITLYARWTADKGDITTENILNCVSDVVTSDTEDYLVLKNDDATFTWSSSNNNLYNINGEIGKTSKIYQTHKNQKVTISVAIKYNNGTMVTKSKEVTIAPVLFNDMPSTPVATYFYTGAISAYQNYNERYKTEGTLFSEDTKNSLDIIYYSFIVPDAAGNVSFQNTGYIEEVNKLKAHDVRIIGCVNGVGTDTCQAFKTITADATLRAKFVDNLMDLVEQYNLDGLDIDWEAVSSTLKPVASQLNLLMEELRAEMTARQAEGGTPYFLSMAVPASSYGTATDRFDFPTLNEYVDYINIMSYDLHNPSKTTHVSPLYKSNSDGGYGFSCDYGISRLVSLGVSRNKLIIGCAGYGKAYKVTGTASSTTYPGLGAAGSLTQISGVSGSYASGTVYGSAIAILLETGKYVQYTEKTSSGQVVASYLYNSADQIFITYDSALAVTAKYNYADSMPGVGIMCWAYTEDTSDIVINAISEAIKAKN